MKWIVVAVLMWMSEMESGGMTVDALVEPPLVIPLGLAFHEPQERAKRQADQLLTNTEGKGTQQIAIKIPTNSKPVPFSPRFGALAPCKIPGLFPLPPSCDMFYVCRQEHSSLGTYVYQCNDQTVFYNLGDNTYECLEGVCIPGEHPTDESPPVVMDPIPLGPGVEGGQSAGPPGYMPTGDKLEIAVGEKRPNEPDHVVKTVIVGSDATVGGLDGEKTLSINIPIKIIQL